MPGFSVKLKAVGTDPKYCCSSCSLLLNEPRQTSCGHRYCKSCLEDVNRASEGHFTCNIPSCSESINIGEMFPDRAIEKEIQKFEVFCDNNDDGCTWEGCLHQLQTHRDECEYEKITCIYKDCGERIPRRDLSKHLTDTCASRLTTCQWCKESHPFKDISKHQESCPMAPARCDWCGKKGLTRSQLQDHQHPQTGDCPNMKLPCHFEPVGCQEKLERKQHGDHLKKTITAHLNMVAALEPRVSTFEGIVAVLNREIEKCSSQIEAYERQRRQDREIIETLERKVRSLDLRIAALSGDIHAEQCLQNQTMTSYDGILTWKIADFTRKRHDAITGKTASFFSPCFFTSRTGYKMCARIYLNGDGMGKGTHVSLFFVLMRGQFDRLLRWPFRQKVTFMLLDLNNREHVIDAFRPDPTSAAFQRPTSDMNIASGCPLFVPLSQLDSSRHAYVGEDTLFIRVIVDTADLH